MGQIRWSGAVTPEIAHKAPGCLREKALPAPDWGRRTTIAGRRAQRSARYPL